MSRLIRTSLFQYVLTILGTCGIVLLGLALSNWLDTNITCLLFFAVIVPAAWYGGWKTGLLATVFSTLAIAFFFFEPSGSLQVHDLGDQLELALFFVLGILIDLLIWSQRLAQEHARTLLEADRRKDEFVAAVAHELRNPLAPIRNALYILGAAGDQRDVIAKARGMLDRQVERMVRLVDDLMDLASVGQGKLAINIERVELQAVIQSAVESCRPFIDEARHELTVNLPAEPIFLDSDEARLTQIISNLLTNAAKYTEPGGQIWLRGAGHGGQVTISIRDTGMGMPAEVLPTVFDMFTQVEGAAKRRKGGLGIGLALVRRLATLLGGRSDARSDGPGKGSEFIVNLPVTLGAAATEKQAPVASAT